MPLIDAVTRTCRRLAPLGWADLLGAHGLDITKADLAKELARPLRRIDRARPGFEDFCPSGKRGIEPGAPSRSLLFHAFASAAVTEGPKPLRGFPTLAELDLLENYCYATRRATIASLRTLAGKHPLAVVVFAMEYRTAPRTTHRCHADQTFSRTGVARVGTTAHEYVGAVRGFTPVAEQRPEQIRVSPVNYAAYLAVQLKGSRAAGRPMRFQGPNRHEHLPGDDRQQFWVPIHKLFSGPECLADHPRLRVTLAAHHVNEKIRRIHLALVHRPNRRAPFDTGWTEPDISRPPFRFTKGIAEFATGRDDPPGLLVPVPHDPLVEPAVYRGRPLGFNVPNDGGFVSSLDVVGPHNAEGDEIRPAPAYVHVRTMMTDAGEVDLNQFSDVAKRVNRGGYRARHYVDFTGDGWVEARVTWGGKAPPGLGRPLPAYSLVTAPDFLFGCDQAELSDWTEQLPAAVQHRVWYMKPAPLSDMRLPVNLQLPRSPFTAEDVTMTAVVSAGLERPPGRRDKRPPPDHPRHTSLPDDAAGIMAPGWDVARDWTLPDRTQHLAAYGLGSPFPEDSKLCAALSAFWPAVAPDATRQFAWTEGQGYRTVVPLTDDEIGYGSVRSWDDVDPPRIIRRGGEEHIVYQSFAHADYTLSAVAKRLTIGSTGRIGQQDYVERTLAMATAYRALGATHYRWLVASYRQAGPEDRERRRAEQATGHQLKGTAHRFMVFYAGPSTTSPKPPFHQQIRVRRRVFLLVDPASGNVLMLRGGRWTHKRVSW
ncbi:MAG: hypothetical protein AB7L66_15180 [Gemmatimonadales bacterium]